MPAGLAALSKAHSSFTTNWNEVTVGIDRGGCHPL
jgi:hypothetical protein